MTAPPPAGQARGRALAGPRLAACEAGVQAGITQRNPDIPTLLFYTNLIVKMRREERQW